MWVSTVSPWNYAPTSSDYYVDFDVGGTVYLSVGATATTVSTFEHGMMMRYFSGPVGSNLVGRGPSVVLGNSISTQFSAYKFRDFEPNFVLLCGGTDQAMGASTVLTTYWNGCASAQNIGGELVASSGQISCTNPPCNLLIQVSAILPSGTSQQVRIEQNSRAGLASAICFLNSPTPSPVAAGTCIAQATLTGSDYVSVRYAGVATTLSANPKFSFSAVEITDPYLYAFVNNLGSVTNGVISYGSLASSNLGDVFAYTDNSRIVTLRACTIYVHACIFNSPQPP